jgi:hypothetical protein
VVFTFWSQVGGQYHLDLMFWPWKFGISLAAAGLITSITADLTREVTYYYHLNEPTDDDENAISRRGSRGWSGNMRKYARRICGSPIPRRRRTIGRPPRIGPVEVVRRDL